MVLEIEYLKLEFFLTSLIYFKPLTFDIKLIHFFCSVALNILLTDFHKGSILIP